jgi:S-sulfo-L-cysteine synthase (O-acetyl-L-serine-dependent)
VTTPQPPAQPAFTLVPTSLGESIIERIGNTPLLRIRLFERECPDVSIVGKAEFMNPGGSVKDRPALRMIEDGERSGRLTRDRVIIDSTSGNTGIAYAMIGAAKGYRVRLVMPANVSDERRKLVAAFGAEVEYSDPLEGSDGAIRMVRAMYDENPEAFFMPDQYNNEANWRAHYDGTGAEIWEQTRGTVTHFVAALGTSGTFMGVTRRLKAINPDVRCISVQPAEPWHGLEGLKHMATSIVPGIYDSSLADEDIGVETEPAYDVARALARTEGILAGHSSGAALWAAGEVAKRIGRGVVVTVLPDGGDRYLSTGLYGRAARWICVSRPSLPQPSSVSASWPPPRIPTRGAGSCSVGATARGWSSSTPPRLGTCGPSGAPTATTSIPVTFSGRIATPARGALTSPASGIPILTIRRARRSSTPIAPGSTTSTSSAGRRRAVRRT